MDQQLIDILRDLYHLQAIAIVLTAGLFGYAIYATVVISRILRELRGDTRR